MNDIQQIKDKIDIAEFIGEYVELKKAGSYWKARCPFHSEKTPSFIVTPEKQIFHCFGCGKGGDVFTFLQEIEGVDFSEALKILADRAGVKLENFKPEINKSRKNQIFEVNELAANFFHRFLLEMPQAKTAKDYIFEKRGLKKEIVEEFKIGFIPEQWSLLTSYLLKKGFGIDLLVEAGLTIKKDNAGPSSNRGYYDRFRGRIMFPIWDVFGNVVGFTGRQLVEDKDKGGKYVNTPETIVFDKSKILYGLNKAKQEIKLKDLAVFVEGQMDVIACHQAGMKNVVASSGTALTEMQVKLINRYTQNIAFAFDSDAAGETAAQRGIGVALEQGLKVKIISIPERGGKDADECLKKNPPVWFEAVSNAQDIMDWHFKRVLGKANFSSPASKQQTANLLLKEIVKIPYAVERNEWLKKLSEKIDVEVEVLKEEAGNIKASTKTISKSTKIGDKKTSVVSDLVHEKFNNMLADFWSLILHHPKYFSSVIDRLDLKYFENTPYLPIYEKLLAMYNKDAYSLNKENLELVFGSENFEHIFDVLDLRFENYFSQLDEKSALNELQKQLSQITFFWQNSKRQELSKKLQVAEQAGNLDEADKILNEISLI